MMFRRNNKSEYNQALDSLNEAAGKAVDRIIFEELRNDDDYVSVLVKKMINGHPLIINFERLNVAEGNKMLAFLAGATFAIEGKTIEVSEQIYLFARNVDFIDGSLDGFLTDYQNN